MTVSRGEAVEKGEIHFHPMHRFTAETLVAYLEQRVKEGDLVWLVVAYEGRSGARAAQAGGDNSVMAYAGALLLKAATDYGEVPGPELLDYSYRPSGEGENGPKVLEKGEIGASEQGEGEGDPEAR